MTGSIQSISAIVAGNAVMMLVLCGCQGRNSSDSAEPKQPAASAAISPPTRQIQDFCGNCHVFPDPSYFPKEKWFEEVQRGFNFYIQSGRTDLSEPKLDDVVQWYRAGAPEKFELPTLLKSDTAPLSFERAVIPGPEEGVPVVAGANWDAGPTGPFPPLRLCDMSTGDLLGIEAQRSGIQSKSVIKTGFLACSKVIDLDGDGVQDLLVADLGSRLPADHQLGRVLFVSGKAPTEVIPLFTGISRIADLNPADFDGDGDLDIVVAEFGWLKTGGIWVLENQYPQNSTQPLGEQSFVPHHIDQRHGTIHVPSVDLNGDGRVDFVALVSQEHEVIEAFLNEGHFQFRREQISRPQDPSSGSSGIEMVDIDQDGDQDFVYCMGDTLDSHLIKPYHGVRLLINEGQFPFREQRLIHRPGACDSATADFDGDGDLDIAVCGYLPDKVVPQMPAGTCDTLFWLEQTQKGQFVPHSIEIAAIGHLAITAGDFDHDGRVDLITGDAFGRQSASGAIWWNKPQSQ